MLGICKIRRDVMQLAGFESISIHGNTVSANRLARQSESVSLPHIKPASLRIANSDMPQGRIVR